MPARATSAPPSTSPSTASPTPTAASSSKKARSIRDFPPPSWGRESWPRELAEALVGCAAVERHVGVGGDKWVAEFLSAQHHGGAARPLEGVSVGIVAVGLPDTHADR